ncbi:hypothetical protein FRC02_006785 [Tulasnella sp. 418]|nr:hypothetical protein FRC02_006785 [Tulasnella sp. 418]
MGWGKVAIKSLRVQGSGGSLEAKQRLLKRFYREVLLWHKLQHPNITPLLGYIMLANKPPALVSPWYIYGNVINYLEQYPNANRNSLALDATKGLEYLHSLPVAHGDLKGENVLVNAERQASLCDFGMSQFLDEASIITGYTTTNAKQGGTDRYMSPELLDDLPKTTASDMWALGCLLVQILADEIPYRHITRRQAVISAIVRGDPPSENRPHVISLSQWQYICKCWRIKPEARPQVSELCWILRPLEPLDPVDLSDLKGFAWVSKPKCTSIYGATALSPDGRYLATVRLTLYTTVDIWEVDKPFNTPLKSLLSQEKLGAVPRLISWSATQEYLMMMCGSTSVWHIESGMLLYSAEPQPRAFLVGRRSLVYQDKTTNNIIIMDLQDLKQTSVSVGGFLPYFALTPDMQRIVTVHSSSTNVYNISGEREFVIENYSSFRSDAQGLSISKDGKYALIARGGWTEASGCKNWRAQLWKVNIKNGKAELSWIRDYRPSRYESTDIPMAHFGGPNDGLVVAVADGTFYIWERNSDRCLYLSYLSSPDASRFSGVLTSFRWNTTNPRDIVLLVGNYILRGLIKT